MDSVKIIIICCFSILTYWQSFAQNVQAPCARSLPGASRDTISWKSSGCSGFSGYVVQQATKQAGPFVSLDTVSTTGLSTPNGNGVRYYRVGKLCNGVLTGLSPVVHNQALAIPDLKAVNLQGRFPVVTWEASTSPEATGYEVYKEQPYGSGLYFPYPSTGAITTGLSFVDTQATDLLNRYAIAVVSDCKKSLFGEGKVDGTSGPHTSMVLTGTLDSCARTITFNWNTYENWRQGVKEYVLWRSVNGAAATPFITLKNDKNSFVYQGANDGEFLKFYIEAREQGRTNSAVTNELVFNISANRPMDFMYFTDASVIDEGTVRLKWNWDTEVDLGSVRLMRGSRPESMLELLTFNSAMSVNNSFQELNLSTGSQAYYYQLLSTDACGFETESPLISTLILKGKPTDNLVNDLGWPTPEFGNAKLLGYRLYRTDARGEKLIANLSADQTRYSDQLEARRFSNAEACYRLVANMQLRLYDGTTLDIPLQSNEFCIKQKSPVLIPNALAPNSQDAPFFRPLFAFEYSVSNYSMQIFDRWGGLLFQTEDIHQGWEGNTAAGKPVKQGVYVYLIQFMQADGSTVVKKGTLTLVR